MTEVMRNSWEFNKEVHQEVAQAVQVHVDENHPAQHQLRGPDARSNKMKEEHFLEEIMRLVVEKNAKMLNVEEEEEEDNNNKKENRGCRRCQLGKADPKEVIRTHCRCDSCRWVKVEQFLEARKMGKRGLRAEVEELPEEQGAHEDGWPVGRRRGERRLAARMAGEQCGVGALHARPRTTLLRGAKEWRTAPSEELKEFPFTGGRPRRRRITTWCSS